MKLTREQLARAARLKASRDASGLTQVQYADKLGIHPITLSRFERKVEPVTRVVDLAVRGLDLEFQEKASESEEEVPEKKPTKNKRLYAVSQ